MSLVKGHISTIIHAIIYISLTPTHKQSYHEICKQMGLIYKKLITNVEPCEVYEINIIKTRWNSIYQMLQSCEWHKTTVTQFLIHNQRSWKSKFFDWVWLKHDQCFNEQIEAP